MKVLRVLIFTLSMLERNEVLVACDVGDERRLTGLLYFRLKGQDVPFSPQLHLLNSYVGYLNGLSKTASLPCSFFE